MRTHLMFSIASSSEPSQLLSIANQPSVCDALRITPRYLSASAVNLRNTVPQCSKAIV